MERKRGNGIGRATVEVATVIESLRESAGMSLEALSHRLGELGRPIHTSGLSKLENGERRIDIDDLAAIAQALEVSIVRLVAHAGELSDSEATGLIGREEEIDRTARFWRRVSRLVDEDREEFSLPAPNEFEVFKRRAGVGDDGND